MCLKYCLRNLEEISLEKWCKKYASKRSSTRVTLSRQDRKLVDLAESMRRRTSKKLNAEWLKYEIKVCASTDRNHLNVKECHYCKVKTKPYMTQHHKKSCLQWCKKYKCWSSDDWEKVILSDESRVCLGTGIFVWRRTDEKFKEDCLKTKAKYKCWFMV